MILGIDFGSSSVDAVLMDGKTVVKQKSVDTDLFNKDLFFKGFNFSEIKEVKATGAFSKELGNKLTELIKQQKNHKL